MGDILMITSGKGGVGKSTISVGLGLALARRGKSCLLLDLDSGLRSLDLLTGIAEQVVYDLSDVLEARCEPIKAIYPASQSPRLHVICAPSDPRYSCSMDAFKRFLSGLRQHYDMVLIDTPAGLGDGVLAAADMADRALLVATPDPVSARSAGKTAEVLSERCKGGLRLIINRVADRPVFYPPEIRDLDDVIDAVGAQLIGVLPEDRSMAAAMSGGGVIDGKTPAETVLQKIAARLCGETLPLWIA